MAKNRIITIEEHVEICRQLECSRLRRVHLGNGVTAYHCTLNGLIGGGRFDHCECRAERERIVREMLASRRNRRKMQEVQP